MGGADMAAYQQPHDPYAIKSDPEHGKLLKKVCKSQSWKFDENLTRTR